jgi:hypothetical protein
VVTSVAALLPIALVRIVPIRIVQVLTVLVQIAQVLTDLAVTDRLTTDPVLIVQVVIVLLVIVLAVIDLVQIAQVQIAQAATDRSMTDPVLIVHAVIDLVQIAQVQIVLVLMRLVQRLKRAAMQAVLLMRDRLKNMMRMQNVLSHRNADLLHGASAKILEAEVTIVHKKPIAKQILMIVRHVLLLPLMKIRKIMQVKMKRLLEAAVQKRAKHVKVMNMFCMAFMRLSPH